MRGEIGAHFPLEAGLQKIGAGDGHRAAVDLGHKGMAAPIEPRSRALLFETLDAHFKLQPLINLPVLEVAELFANVVNFGFEPIHLSFDCRESHVDFRKFLVHVASEIGDFLMHACEMRSQR
jgi:hypothetical protein